MERKPYRTIVYYSGASDLRRKLTELGVKFTEKYVFSGFHGTQFDIQRPTGKGAHQKMREVDKL